MPSSRRFGRPVRRRGSTSTTTRRCVRRSGRAEGSPSLTASADLDRHNFETLPLGMAIGWVTNALCPLQLRDAAGRDRAGEYFRIEAGRLLTRRAFVPLMITTNPGIARSDCLFYVAA